MNERAEETAADMSGEEETGAVGGARDGVGAVSGEEMAALRELALQAHPDVVPELVGGASVAELIASLEPARAAYHRIAEATGVAAHQPRPAAVPVVPAGNAPRFAVDVDRLPTAEKIRRGLADRGR